MPNLPAPAPESHAGFVLVFVTAGRMAALVMPVRGGAVFGGAALGAPILALLLGSARGALELNGRFSPDTVGVLAGFESAELQELLRSHCEMYCSS